MKGTSFPAVGEKARPTRRAVRWLEAFVLAAVHFYQAALRPLNPWGCKFYPSCSQYALEAIERHGLARGSWLSLRRILRCRPGVFGGYDLVPEACGGPSEARARKAGRHARPERSRRVRVANGIADFLGL